MVAGDAYRLRVTGRRTCQPRPGLVGRVEGQWSWWYWGGDDDRGDCLPVEQEAVEDVLELFDGGACTLTRKQSSPVMRWHSVTCGSVWASSAMVDSLPVAGRMRASAVTGSPSAAGSTLSS